MSQGNKTKPKTPSINVKVEEEEDGDDDDEEKEPEEETLDDSTDDIIVLNVGGKRHETRIRTLKKYDKKTNRLNEVAKEAEETGKKEFYFDRHPDFFPYILNFYRLGKLHVPLNICGPMIKEELSFWQIDDKDIEQCCWVHYIKYEETQHMLEKFDKDDRHHRLATRRIQPDASCFQRKRPRVWRFLQDPYSSKGSLVYALASLIVVLISITVFSLETLPFFGAIMVHSRADRKNFTSADLREEMNIFGNTTPLSVLLIIDNICNLFFLSELIIKFVFAPFKRKYLMSPMTIVELICLIPYYIAMIVVFSHPDPIQIFGVVRILIALRVLRIFRIFVLMKHFLALRVLMHTIIASTKELFLLLLVVLIGVVIFACLVYYVEIFTDEPSDFEHIPIAFWWALITMTTVGYGDMVPSTGLGYTVGAMCAISGVLVIALSVPAIVQNFTLYYTHAQARLKLKQRKRIYRQAKWSSLRNKLKDQGNDKPSLMDIVRMAKHKESLQTRRKSSVNPVSNGSISSGLNAFKKRSNSVAAAVSKKDLSNLLKPTPSKTASDKESKPNTLGNALLERLRLTKSANKSQDNGVSNKESSQDNLQGSKSPSVPNTENHNSDTPKENGDFHGMGKPAVQCWQEPTLSTVDEGCESDLLSEGENRPEKETESKINDDSKKTEQKVRKRDTEKTKNPTKLGSDEEYHSSDFGSELSD